MLLIYRLEVAKTFSSGLINLLEWLTQLRGTFTCVYQFIIKDIIKDTDEYSDEEVHRV